MKKVGRKLKKFITKFFLINDTPHKVAAGAALGFFLGTIPGEGVFSTMVMASLLRFNRLAALSGVLATNMWMTVVTLPPAAYVGGTLFGIEAEKLKADFRATYDAGVNYFFSKVILLELLLPLMVGFIIVAGSLAIIFYLGLYLTLKKRELRLGQGHVLKLKQLKKRAIKK